MTFHTETLRLVSGGGTASGTISVVPSRVAGVFYEFTPTTARGTISMSNLNRDIFHTFDARNSDPVTDSLPGAEQLVYGDIAVGAATFADDVIIDIKLWLDYGR